MSRSDDSSCIGPDPDDCVASYEPIVNRVAERIVKSFEEAAANGPVDPQPILALHTQHLSVGTHFGITPEEVDKDFIQEMPHPMKRLTE